MIDDIVGVLTKVEDDTDQGGKDYKKVTLGTGQVLKVKQGRDQVLMAKWGLLEVGKAVVFKMAEFTNKEGVKFPFVSDIKLVADELQPPVKPIPPIDPNQAEIDKVKPKTDQQTRSEEIAHHVAMKEIGEGIRSGLIKNTGATAPYWKLYWLWLSATLSVKPETKGE